MGTMKGLSTNEVKVKHQTMYKAQYVKKKLEDFVCRLLKLREVAFRLSRTENDSELSFKDAGKVTLTEKFFLTVIHDKRIAGILEELDIDLGASRDDLFDIFRPDDQGRIELPELLNTLMRLRGSTTKVDMIAPRMAMSGLSDKMHDLQDSMAESYKDVQKHQRRLLDVYTQKWGQAVSRSKNGA